MKTIKVLFAALVMAISFNSTAQLTSTEKTKFEKVYTAMMWFDVQMGITGTDTTYLLSYVNQEYPNLRPTDNFYFDTKKDLTDMLQGVVSITSDERLSGNGFTLSKGSMGVYFYNDTKGKSYTIITKKQAEKALTSLGVN